MGKPIATPEAFIEAWQTSNSTKEVCEKLGLKNAVSAAARASRMRKNGVPLKHFDPRGGVAYDWRALKELARGLSSEPVPNRKNGALQ